MLDSLKQRKASLGNKSELKTMALDFISAGIGCNCLVALSEAGILKQLLKNGSIDKKVIENSNNPICVKSALVTLEKCEIIERDCNIFKITEFGMALSEYIGLITIFFDGYSTLVANQSQIVQNKCSNLANLVKWPVVAKSSIHISEKTVDIAIAQELMNLKLSGTICDLGCGCGVMLSKICHITNNPGLGFESSPSTVNQAQAQLAGNITVEVADITNLQGVWEDVVFLMQAFVFHDFTPNENCINIMDSYLENFPNLKYFFYIDIMTPSPAKNELFPGFDYVHGLLGTSTRTYEETLNMFDQSKYTILKEVSIPDLPNTFLWILSPKRGI